jgi:hypothetical protein
MTVMFLWQDPDSKGHILFAPDPRPGGCPGLVREVSYSEPSGHHDWSDGDARADCCLGVARGDDTVYQAFHSRRECEEAGFHYVTSNYGLYGSWEHYQKMRKALARP